jgi:hypothetical protein
MLWNCYRLTLRERADISGWPEPVVRLVNVGSVVIDFTREHALQSKTLGSQRLVKSPDPCKEIHET